MENLESGSFGLLSIGSYPTDRYQNHVMIDPKRAFNHAYRQIGLKYSLFHSSLSLLLGFESGTERNDENECVAYNDIYKCVE